MKTMNIKRFMKAFAALSMLGCVGELAVAKPVSYEHYSRLPAVYDAAISPDGNFMAAVIDNDGAYIVRVFNIKDPSDKTIRASKYGAEVKVNWIKWANNDQLLLSTRQTSKIDSTIINTGYLYAMDKDLKSGEMLVSPEIKTKVVGKRLPSVTGYRQFNNVVVDFLDDDPDHILMSYGLENQFAPGVHKVNVRTKKAQRNKRGSENFQNWITDLRSELRIGEGRNDRTGDYSMTIRDANADKWRSVQEYPGLSAETNVYGFTANPNELVIGDYKGKDTRGFYIYDLGQKKVTRKLYHHDRYDMRGLVHSADGKKLVGATYLADTKKTVYFDDAYEARVHKVETQFDGEQVQFIDQTANGNTVLLKSYSASTPPSLMVYREKTGQISRLADDYPEMRNVLQGDVMAVKYTARDGYKIPSYVTLPSKIADGMPLKNLPFIIMPHGGPFARDTQSFDTLAQFMASRGYGVLQMNFRGSTGLGAAHRDAGQGNWEVMQDDVEDGARWLISKGYADPKRVCMVGWSYGGYAALMGAIENPDLYACSVSIAGVTDLNDLINDLKKYRFGKFAAKYTILDGFESRHDIKKNSPVKRADELRIPLLLVHGEKDVTVHFDQFRRMKNALKKSGAKVSYLSFEDGDHSLTSFEDRRELYKALDKFLADNLGDSAAAP